MLLAPAVQWHGAMRFLLASLPALALACGGSIGPIDPAGLHVEGSYDLVLSNVSGDPNPQPYAPPTTTHPGIGQHARLDIRKVGASYEAAVTPEFGSPASMTVSFGQDGTMTLQGTVPFSSSSSSADVTDELDALHLGVAGDGHLSGSFTAEGQTTVFEGDVAWQGSITAGGSIGADARAPQARISAYASAPSVLLPWDEINAQTSEPVDATALDGALGLTPGSVSWQVSPSALDWLGATEAYGYRTSWSDFSGPATLSIAGGLVDPSGNVSNATSVPVTFLDVPQAAAFDGTTLPAMWGAAAPASGTDACGTAGSCVEIGPLEGPCNAQPGGIAGRLPATGTKLSITYRLRVASQYGQPQWPSGLGVSVAVPGQAAQLVAPSMFPTLNPTGDATYPYASDWTTDELTVSATGPEIGFSVVPFAGAQSYCGGELGFAPVTVVVDVVQVKLTP
jgi:hypothetical protein